MRRRRLLLGAGALALLVLGLACWFAFVLPPAPPPGVTEGNFYRLRLGMAEADVEAVLGTPGNPLDFGKGLRVWEEPKGAVSIILSFDAAGRVTSGSLYLHDTAGGVLRPQDDPLGRLRAWLGW
jgi:hypothetical protein